MLVYIRESDKEKIMCTVDEKDIAEHLRVCTICTIILLFLCGLHFWYSLVENCGFAGKVEKRTRRERTQKERKS